jgi:hypothetical protein
MGPAWRPRIRRQGQHRKLRERVAHLEQQHRQALGEVARLRARVLAGEALAASGAAPAAEVPVELLAAMGANARWVELPGCVALLSCGPRDPQAVWEAVQRVTAAEPAGEGVTGMRRELLPPGLRGIVTAKGVITICTGMPRASQKAAASEARVHGVTRGWLPGTIRAGTIAAVAAAGRRPALSLLLAAGAVGTAAAIAVAVAPCPPVLHPVQSASPAPPAAMVAAPHVHRRRELAARPGPRPQAPASLVPPATPSDAPPGPAAQRPAVPVPLPSASPSPIVCVRTVGLHVCLPALAA